MSRVSTILFRFLRISFFVSLVLAGMGVVVLACCELPVPACVLERLTEAVSSETYLVHVDAAHFRLTRGLHVTGLKVFDRTKVSATPFLSAARVEVHLALGRLPWRRATIIHDVTVRRLYFPRLPDGYYIPDSIEFPGQPDFKEVSAPVDVTFPDVPPFKLILIEPDVLAVRPARVDVAAVTISPKVLRVTGIDLQWPDRDVRMSLDGETAVDIFTQSVRGHVHGQARLPNIRPLLGALEITNSYSFMDAFTGVRTPVDATCQYDVNLINNDLHLFLDLHPTGGAYRGVPFVDAHGLLDIRVFVRDTYQNAKIVVGPLAAHFPDGRMEGTVIYENTNDVGYVTFNVESTVALSNALAVANVLTDGTLDCLQPETPPYIALKGITSVDPAYAATNDLRGELRFARGRFFDIPLQETHTRFHVRGTRVDFTDASARAPHGGQVTGSGWVSYPGFTVATSRFGVALQGQDVTLADLTAAFGIDVGPRTGRVTGQVTFEGPLGAEAAAHLTGGGHVSLVEGNLATFNLLSGLFDAIAAVPGMARLVEHSREVTGIVIDECAFNFTLADGVISSDDLRLHGGIFTIAVKGRYDYLHDALDLAVRVQIVRDESLAGFLKNPLLWPFSKLSSGLLGFRATGSRDAPKWQYDPAILSRF